MFRVSKILVATPEIREAVLDANIAQCEVEYEEGLKHKELIRRQAMVFRQKRENRKVARMQSFGHNRMASVQAHSVTVTVAEALESIRSERPKEPLHLYCPIVEMVKPVLVRTGVMSDEEYAELILASN